MYMYIQMYMYIHYTESVITYKTICCLISWAYLVTMVTVIGILSTYQSIFIRREGGGRRVCVCVCVCVCVHVCVCV